MMPYLNLKIEWESQCMVFEIRIATLDDVDFLVAADIATDVEDIGDRSQFTDKEAKVHREKIIAFIQDDDKRAWIAHQDKFRTGMILCRYRNYEEAIGGNISFQEMGRDVFPEDGLFIEVYQLRVAENFRRRRIATHLKRHAEIDARLHGVKLIYTHTAIEHVLEMNLKMGYREVRRGTMWDDKIRISLVKDL